MRIQNLQPAQQVYESASYRYSNLLKAMTTRGHTGTAIRVFLIPTSAICADL